MPRPPLSLAVVGADFSPKKGPSRRFEIAMCKPGEPIELRLEPHNPADPRAVAVYSKRGIQIGYLTAERCGLVGNIIRSGTEAQAIFQHPATYGAVIRVAFDGEHPTLPEPKPRPDWDDADVWWADETYKEQ